MEQLFQEESRLPPASQAVDRGAQLLVAVLASERPVGVTELARATELPKSTVSRLLGVLESHGLITQDGPRGALRPGPAILTYAQRGLYERTSSRWPSRRWRRSRPPAARPINLAVPGSAGVEHLAQFDGRHFLGAGQWVGRRVDYHCTAVGKVFLATGVASLPPGPLAPLAPATITTPRSARDRARAGSSREGYAAAVDELEAGLAAIAAPVHGEGERVVAALSITGPTLRLAPREIARLVPVLKLEAQRLSRRLGHRQTGEHAA